MDKIKKLLLVCTCLLALTLNSSAQLVTYDGKPNMPWIDDYTVKVRDVRSNEWKDLYEYKVNVDMDRVQDATMVQFAMGSPVEVMVKKNNGLIQQVDIRPFSKNITYRKERNTIFFTLNKPQYLSVEFNGDRLHNLHLFANPLETETYNEGDKNVMYFGPGVHKPSDLPNNTFCIPSNTIVYLAPGAVVQGRLLVNNAENVKILGQGILDHPFRGVEVTNSKNVLIDGLTVVNPQHYTIFGGNADGLTIRNLKSFSTRPWSDGIDLMCCSNVIIDNIFMRNSDDCIAMYAHRWDYYGGSHGASVTNAVLWADVAHPINIGGHGNLDDPVGEVVENLHFKDIDILEQDEDDKDYQGCMAVDCGDKNLVRNITFENVRVEDIQEGRLFHVRVRFNAKYDKQPGRGIENVLFKNISYTGVGENPSLIQGYDKNRMVKNVTFENVLINGKRMKDISGFLKNDFIKGIQVK